MTTNYKEGLGCARFVMVLCSFSPLFILWAIRGTKLIPDCYFIAGCIAFAVLPNIFLWWRIKTAKRLKELRELVIGSADDHRDHLVVYLFVMLLPLYPIDLSNLRELTAALAALAFVAFVFWHLNLHYMNVVFAALGYRVFSISPPKDDNPLSGKIPFGSHQPALFSGWRASKRLIALSDTVYFEGKNGN